MLLILKPKRKVGKLASRLGGPRQQFIDWFTDTECKMKTVSMGTERKKWGGGRVWGRGRGWRWGGDWEGRGEKEGTDKGK